MLIGDGVLPGNDGRGYVLRRLLRRVVRSARLLGAEEPTMGAFIGRAIDLMSPSYPELETQRRHIVDVAVGEETSFSKTLAAGSKLFADAATATKSASRTTITGSDAFTLHDTYGFPIDLTVEMAREAGLDVDMDAFNAAMQEQRERARAELTAEITRSARDQLREVGAAALSLRAVARDLGLASSAVYRYFPSRDALLTALITDAYTALGDAVEAVIAIGWRDQPPRARISDAVGMLAGMGLRFALAPYGRPSAVRAWAGTGSRTAAATAPNAGMSARLSPTLVARAAVLAHSTAGSGRRASSAVAPTCASPNARGARHRPHSTWAEANSAPNSRCMRSSPRTTRSAVYGT